MIEAREAAKFSTVCRTAPTTKNYPARNVSNASSIPVSFIDSHTQAFSTPNIIEIFWQQPSSFACLKKYIIDLFR